MKTGKGMSAYHQLVVVVGLVECHGRLLMMRRYDVENVQWHHKWEFPGGKIEPNETPLVALHREIDEETGLKIYGEKLLGVHTHNWHTPKGIQQTFILLYHCKADSDNVRLNLEENDAFVWEKPEEILKRPNLLDGTIKILEEFYLHPDSILLMN